MQKKGVEPSRYCYHTDLNRARLPIPPLLQTIVAANIFIASMLISITHCLINVNCFLNYLFFLFYFNFIQYILIKHKHNPSKLIYIFNKYYYLYCFGLQKQYINILLHLMLLFIQRFYVILVYFFLFFNTLIIFYQMIIFFNNYY